MIPSEYHAKVEEKWTEHQHQVMLCRHLDALGYIYNSTPNGGKRHIGVARKLKAEGAKPGFPDLTVFLPHVVLYIELKKTKGGTVSKEQKQWLEDLNRFPYATAKVCRGWREALEFVQSNTFKPYKENEHQSSIYDYLEDGE